MSNEWYEEAQRIIIQRWKDVFNQHSVLENHYSQDVSYWEITSGERYSLIPHYFKRKGSKPSELLDEIPEDAKSHNRYGFSTDKKVLWYQHTIYGDFGMTLDTFYYYDRERIEWVEFVSYEPYHSLPLHISHLYIDDNVPQHLITFKLSGVQFPPPQDWVYTPDGVLKWLERGGNSAKYFYYEIYQYVENKLSQITVEATVPAFRGYYTAEEFIIYNYKEEIQRIKRTVQDKVEVLYQLPDNDKTYAQLRDDSKKVLLQRIPESLKHIKGKVAFITLYWHVEAMFDQITPYIGFRLESERIKAKDDEFWYPHPSISVSLNEDEEAICRAFLQEASAISDWFATRDLFREVASELTKTQSDWVDTHLNVVDDFVMFVNEEEYHLDNLQDSLRESVSEKQIELWKTTGYFKNTI